MCTNLIKGGDVSWGVFVSVQKEKPEAAESILDAHDDDAALSCQLTAVNTRPAGRGVTGGSRGSARETATVQPDQYSQSIVIALVIP